MRFIGLCIAAAVLFIVPACSASSEQADSIVIPDSGRGSTWISGQAPDPERIDASKLDLEGLSKPTDEVVNNYDAVRMVGTQCVLVIDQMELGGPYVYNVAIVPNDETRLVPHEQNPDASAEDVKDFVLTHEAACA